MFLSIFVEVNSKPNMKNIVGVIYRPNSQPKADLDIFMSTFSDLMISINNEKKHNTIMDDFNIDLLKYNLHEKTNDFVDNIIANGYFLPTVSQC